MVALQPEILYTPIARKMTLLLRYIAAELDLPNSGGEMLFEILHYNWFQVSREVITLVTAEAADKKHSRSPVSLRQLLAEKSSQPPIDLFTLAIDPQLKQAAGLLEKWIAMAATIAPDRLPEALTKETSIQQYLTPEESQTIVPAFLNYLWQQAGSHSILSLSSLVHMLDRILKENPGTPAFTAARPEILKDPGEWIKGRLRKFVMNVSALNCYLRCPLEFYYKYVIRIPAPKNEAFGYGSAVHGALQKLFEKMKQTGEQFAPVADLISDFEGEMHLRREEFTSEQFSRRMEQGRIALTLYYEEYLHQWNKIIITERNIRNVLVNGVPLKGKPDKLEFNGKEVTLVDYKTGDPDKSEERLQPPNESHPHGGDYWRQAVFYKILIDNYPQKSWNVVRAEFDFVEQGKEKVYRKKQFPITPADITTVTQQITSVWAKIQAADFYTGCGQPHCHWCRFVKTNHRAVKLHEIQ